MTPEISLFTMSVLNILSLVVILLVATSEAWFLRSGSSGSSGNTGNSNNFNYDISTPAGLRRLYNARVIKAERWERPLAIGVNPTVAHYLGLTVK